MNKVLLIIAALLLVASCAPYRPWGGPGMGMMGGPGWNCSGGYWGNSGYYAPVNYDSYGGYGR